MPAYDYRCRVCDVTFEVRRGLAAPAEPPACPVGHRQTGRVYTAVALAGAHAVPAPRRGATGGGCCGGGCCG